MKPATVADWQLAISRLETDLATLLERDAELRRERTALSLAVALGDPEARERAGQLDIRGLENDLEVRTVREALQQATAGLKTAQDGLQAARNSERAAAIAVALETRQAAAKQVDGALKELAVALADWLATGDGIAALGGDGHCKQARGQLAAAIWYHLSGAGLNRSDSWKFRTLADVFSGDSRPSPARWRPLADHP